MFIVESGLYIGYWIYQWKTGESGGWGGGLFPKSFFKIRYLLQVFRSFCMGNL